VGEGVGFASGGLIFFDKKVRKNQFSITHCLPQDMLIDWLKSFNFFLYWQKEAKTMASRPCGITRGNIYFILKTS
jgi:hypothetical protein